MLRHYLVDLDDFFHPLNRTLLTIVEVRMTATALVNEAGQMHAIATTERAKTSD